MKGLTSLQARGLLSKNGPNSLSYQSKRTFIRKIVEQFNNFLTYLLLTAAVISLMIGEVIDGSLILAIIILNGLFGLYQEQKAEGELEKLSALTITTVRVIRDGAEIQIDSRELVPGDCVFIEEGTKIAADGKLDSVVNLEVNEAALTGESFPVTKAAGDEIYNGTVVSRGRGFFIVTKTGMNTKFGEIAEALSQVTKEKTPLQRKLIKLTRIIGYAGVSLAVIVFLLSYAGGAGYFPAFLLAVSLAVAVVPEGLPAVTTITLAIGVGEMAKKKSIIRRLSAIESLGSVTLIATDKTGTLTTNNMRVKDVFVVNSNFQLPISKQTLNLKSQNALNLLLLDGILCSTASLVPVHGKEEFDILGDPTEGALLLLAKDAGLNPEEVRKSWKLIEESPFDSTTKMMSVVVQNDKSQTLFSKGAPESILKISSKILEGDLVKPMSADHRREFEKKVEHWAKQGLRVIAFAYNPINSLPHGSTAKNTNESVKQFSKDMIFLGLVAIHDPPRPEVKESIRIAKAAGIRVVMITGDNEITAEAIGVATGLLEPGDEIMTGYQIEEYADEELMKHLTRVKAFARTTPLHKTRIVKLYQRLGEVVAVTGDGVNDAIALKQADVGVAMGLVGTDVARETADMIVTDDNFASIVDAIEEGRHIIRNLKNAIKYLLASNLSEAIALITAIILGVPYLFFPIQLLYINLIGDGLPALALAFAPREEAVMSQAPNKHLSLLGRFDQYYIIAVGILTSGLVLFSYFIFAPYNEPLARTAAFSALALTQGFIFIDLWLSHRSFLKNIKLLKSKLFFATFVVTFILQWIIVSTPPVAKIFKVVPARISDFGLFILIACLVLPGISLVKKILPRPHYLK